MCQWEINTRVEEAPFKFIFYAIYQSNSRLAFKSGQIQSHNSRRIFSGFKNHYIFYGLTIVIIITHSKISPSQASAAFATLHCRQTQDTRQVGNSLSCSLALFTAPHSSKACVDDVIKFLHIFTIFTFLPLDGLLRLEHHIEQNNFYCYW